MLELGDTSRSRNGDGSGTCANEMSTLQGQQHALYQKITRLSALNQQFRNAGSPGLAEIATEVGQAVQTAMAIASTRSNERQSLVDIKGLIGWVEDQDNVITNNALEPQFGPLSEELVGDVLELSEQFHVALSAFDRKRKLRHRSWSRSIRS